MNTKENSENDQKKTINDIIEKYKKLNDKCDEILIRIKKRKQIKEVA